MSLGRRGCICFPPIAPFYCYSWVCPCCGSCRDLLFIMDIANLVSHLPSRRHRHYRAGELPERAWPAGRKRMSTRARDARPQVYFSLCDGPPKKKKAISIHASLLLQESIVKRIGREAFSGRPGARGAPIGCSAKTVDAIVCYCRAQPGRRWLGATCSQLYSSVSLHL